MLVKLLKTTFTGYSPDQKGTQHGLSVKEASAEELEMAACTVHKRRQRHKALNRNLFLNRELLEVEPY